MARSARRGLVFLYAISVFTVIAAIGMTILESGENFVDLAQGDIYNVAAQQAALSGMAYGEAMIWRLLHIRDPLLGNPDGTVAPRPRFPGAAAVPMPFWAGAKPATPYGYIALQGWGWDALAPNDQAARYTFVHEMAGTAVGSPARLLGQFRIELRDCSVETPTTPGCVDDLFDMNLRRNGIFWPNQSSNNKPSQPLLPVTNPGAPPAIPVRDTAFLYTMRVEGLTLRVNDDGSRTRVAHCALKQAFSFTEGSSPEFEFSPQAFWYHSLQRGY
jgi:hypothetical protein